MRKHEGNRPWRIRPVVRTVHRTIPQSSVAQTSPSCYLGASTALTKPADAHAVHISNLQPTSAIPIQDHLQYLDILHTAHCSWICNNSSLDRARARFSQWVDRCPCIPWASRSTAVLGAFSNTYRSILLFIAGYPTLLQCTVQGHAQDRWQALYTVLFLIFFL